MINYTLVFRIHLQIDGRHCAKCSTTVSLSETCFSVSYEQLIRCSEQQQQQQQGCSKLGKKACTTPFCPLDGSI